MVARVGEVFTRSHEYNEKLYKSNESNKFYDQRNKFKRNFTEIHKNQVLIDDLNDTYLSVFSSILTITENEYHYDIHI